jgi:hypothetical protein
MRTALSEMGHPQPATPLETDNSTAHGILCAQVRMKRSKALTCVIIGSKIALLRSNSTFTGPLGAPTVQVTFLNTILLHIINSCAIIIFIARLMRPSCRLLCEGVLLPTGVLLGYNFTGDVMLQSSSHHSSH